MDEPVTPDNTRVLRIMNDFHEFVRSSTQHSGSSSGNRSSPPVQRRGIPCNIPEEEDGEDSSNSAKRRRYTSEVFANAKIARIESKHASDEKAHRLAQFNLEKRNEQSLSENKLLRKKCDDLQLKINLVTMQAIEAQDKLAAFKNEKANDKENLEEMLLNLQKEKAAQETDLQMKIERFKESDNELKQRNSNCNMQMTLLREKLDETTALLGRKMNRVEQLTEDLKEYEACEAKVREQQIKIQDLELRLSRSSEAEQMAKVMKDDLERLHKLDLRVVKLQDQNETFRENESNVELMKEKLLAAEAKLARNEKVVEKAVIIKLENKDLLAQLDEAKCKEIPGISGADIMAKLRDLRQNEALQASEKGEIHSELKSYKKTCEILQTSIKNLERNLNQRTEALTTKDTQLKHLHRRVLLLTGERNSLRGILQSYDAELAASSHADQLLNRAQTAETANEKVHSRLIEVEKEAEKYAEEATNLRLKVKAMQSSIGDLQKSIEEGGVGSKDQEIEIEKLRQKVEEMEKEREELQKQKEHLDLWVERNKMRGDFDPSRTKVFHFQMNPADLAHKQAKLEVTELRAKCFKLQEKIMKLESNQDITTTDVTLVQNKEVQEKLAAAAMKNQRLKEIFSKRIQEFRQACYTLTGYRIDFTGDTQLQFKLVSMYAEKESDDLLFNTDSSGSMHLLETDYSKTLKNLIELHLHHQNSIPMFLSSLTADLFSQQTMAL